MAVDMFMKIKGIEGEAEDKAHKNAIDVLAWSWGCSNSGTTHVGGGGGSGKVSVNDLSFTKYIDSASNALLMACCKGTHHDDATLIVRKAGGNPVEYVVIKMTEVMVTSISTGGSGGEDRLTENVTLNFAKFEYKYQPQDEKGAKKGGTKDANWDIAGNAEG
mgnify:FL=1